MRYSLVISSVCVATAVFSINQGVYGQCSGGNCPAYNVYDQTPNYPNYQDNRNWQGNQNPNWQGNQTPNWRNDAGWRDGKSNYYQSNQNSQNYYYKSEGSDANSSHANAPFSAPAKAASSNSNQSVNENSYFQNSNGQSYYYQDMSKNNQLSDNSSSSSTATSNTKSAETLLQNKVYDTLKNNYLRKNYNDVNVTLFNGTATLSGFVESDEDRHEVESRVRAVDGIVNVNDQIQIRPSSQQMDSYTSKDVNNVVHEELQNKVDSALKNNYVKKNYPTVSTEVFNGIVTLSGSVESDRDRQEIKDRILKIKGVRSIQDNLTIAPAQTSFRSTNKANNLR